MEWCVIAAFPNCAKIVSFILTLLFSQFVHVTIPDFASSCLKAMPSLDRNLPVKCTKCNKTVIKINLVRHKQPCDSGTLFGPKCPYFSPKKKEDKNYDIAKHHAPKDTKLSTMWTVCLEQFPSFYSLQQHKRRKHGTSTNVGKYSSEKLNEVLESEELEKDNVQLQKELSACQHFFDDTAMESGRHQVFNFKLFMLNPHETNKKLKKKYSKTSTVLPKSTGL